MLAARKPCLGTIELLAQPSFYLKDAEFHQAGTLAEVFHCLGQSGEICLLSSPGHDRMAEMPRFAPASFARDVEYAPADLMALEVELAQELALVLGRLQR